MKKVLFRAPVLTASGYGVHSRQIFRWLNEKDNIDLYVDALPWGHTPWLLNETYDSGLIGKVLSKVRKSDRFDISIQVQLPNEWDKSKAPVNVGITAGVETDKCNQEWIEHVNSMNMVVVPSKHVLNTFKNTGHINSSIKVIPECYIDEIDNSITNNDLNFTTSFNFLAVGQLTGQTPESDRKNIFSLIKWFCEIFQDDSDVGLILKINSGRMSQIDRDSTLTLIKNLISEYRKTAFPKIHVLHGYMNDKEMARLYQNQTVKALVTTTRGEGFGLPILEAAASGLPVIAPDWSGYLDFMNMGKFIKIESELKEIHTSKIDGQIFIPGSKWANVSEDDFKKKMKKFREKPDVVFNWAKDLSKMIKNTHSFRSIAAEYDKAFEGII